MLGSWIYIRALHCLFSVIVLSIPVSSEDNYEMGKDAEIFTNIRGLQGVQKCGPNTLGNVTGAFVTGCNKVPCRFGLTTKYHIFIEGILERDHETLIAVFGIKISGLSVKAVQVNACNQIADGQKCPLQKGKTYLFSLVLDLKTVGVKYFPSLGNFLAFVKIRDPITKESLCAVVPSTLAKDIN